MNDKNSSTLREFITVSLAGYKHRPEKIGHNGFRQNTEIGGEVKSCEAKPQNISSEDTKNKKSSRKLDGGGNFTDYTNKRLKKDLTNDLSLLISGFVDGQLLYVFEFPFRFKSFVKRLKIQLKKRFPKGDKSGQYLRGDRFNYKDYMNCP